MEEKKCYKCLRTLSVDQFYKLAASKDGYYNRCKSCDKAVQKQYYTSVKKPKKAKLKEMGNKLLGRERKNWVKTNKNHYPDSEWVWTQLENGVTGKNLYDKIETKYALSTHGNLGKKHKTHTNPWIKRRNDEVK